MAFDTILLLLLVWCVGSSAGQGYNYGFDISKLARRGGPDPFVVTGMPRVNGITPIRPEIRALQQDPDKWTLYILALSLMQYTDQTQPFSWYQIAGIHGVPYMPWGDVLPTPGNERSGYCNHVSILFPTWHRPYLALYEQLICALEQYIATLYPDEATRNRFVAAAADCRIPYFDWAASPPPGDSVFPVSIGANPMVEVDGPNGRQMIANPLYTYQFKPLDPTVFFNVTPWSTWDWTMRAPTTLTTAAQSNNTFVAQLLDANLPSFQQRLYTLFSNYGNYSAFSNEAWIPEGHENEYDSLESLHDSIHNILGGGVGHMAYIPFSSFDPLFFLHHAMIDRIFAMWQALYPASWITPEPARMNSYTTSLGQIQDSGSPLTPFFVDSSRNFWTSDLVRDPEALGYTYAEIAGISLTNPVINETARAQVIAAINRLYGGSSPGSLAIARRGHSLQGAFSPRKRATDPSRHPGSDTATKRVIVSNEYREWTANIRTKKQALDGPFSITLFLGDVPTDPRNWCSDPGAIGTMSIFAAPAMHARKMLPSGRHTTGTIPMTSALATMVAEGILPSLEVGDIEPYLRAWLQVRVLRADGTPVDPSKVADLSIRIVSSRVRAASSEAELPQWGDADFSYDFV